MNLAKVVGSPLLGRLLGGRAGPDWDALATSAARLLSEGQIWKLFELAVADLGVALCLHRVSRNHKDALTMPIGELDAFVERAQELHRKSPGPWLTLTFDDGYDDACYYIETRAKRFRDVEWLLFVCPDKAETRAGFRWDLEGVEDRAPCDRQCENLRPELRGVVRLRDCHLATVDQCLRLRRLGHHVQIGNHTNCHFRAVEVPLDAMAEELRQSHADFVRLFGAPEHFAFPFGMPERDFDARHVEVLRKAGEFVIWTTARRPYPFAHRYPGAVLPRFPVDGRWSASQLAFWVAMLTLRARTRGLGAFYPALGPPLDASPAATWPAYAERSA